MRLPRITIPLNDIDHGEAVKREREIAAQIITLQRQVASLKQEARDIANAEAQKLSTLRVGQEVECEYGYSGKTKGDYILCAMKIQSRLFPAMRLRIIWKLGAKVSRLRSVVHPTRLLRR